LTFEASKWKNVVHKNNVPVTIQDNESFFGDSDFGSSAEPTSESDTDHKENEDSGMGRFAYFKILSTLLYLVTLSFGIGYFMTTKFTSILTYYLFLGTLLARPVLIGFYSLLMIVFVCF